MNPEPEMMYLYGPVSNLAAGLACAGVALLFAFLSIRASIRRAAVRQGPVVAIPSALGWWRRRYADLLMLICAWLQWEYRELHREQTLNLKQRDWVIKHLTRVVRCRDA